MKVAASPSAKVASPVQVADLDRCARPETGSLPSACLVICYFGPPPGWINHYLISCAYNPSINFLIFTDQDDFPAAPPNVRVERLSRSSFNELATSKLGFEINVSRPYKLCDFKPTYGHLFEEYLESFDYWGYADVDVVYGDVRRFLSLARFEKYDVFTARKEFIAGHFTLFRNNRRMRMLYQRSGDYRTTLQNSDMLSFSECGKQWGRRMRGEPLTDDATCDSMMHVITRQVAAGKLSACYAPAAFEWPDINPNATWRIRWHLGRLWSIDRDREAMYFHFNSFRRRPGYHFPPSFDFETAFDMAAKGFEPAKLPRKPARKPARKPLASRLQEWF